MTAGGIATVGSVLRGIIAGKSVQTLDRPPLEGELAILKVSAVTWGEFRPSESKAMPAGYEPGDCPRAMNGDIIISRANTRELVGAPVMVCGDHPRLLLSDKLLKLVPNESLVDRRYLVRALRAPVVSRHFAQCAGGTSGSMTNITQDNIRSAPLFLPPLTEQRRIAAILDQADALRAKRRESLAQLDSLTQSIFIEMFGDPVRNAPRWPLVRFATKLAAPLRNGLSPSSNGSFQAKVLTLSAITGNHFDPSAIKNGKFASIPPAGQSVDKIDFLICRGNGSINLVGKGRFPSLCMPGVTFPDTMIAARLSPSRVAFPFLQILWNSPAVRIQIEKLARTTNGTFKVNQSMLEGVLIADPPLALQQTFATRIQAVESLKATHRAALAESETLFSSIQHRAFRGEL